MPCPNDHHYPTMACHVCRPQPAVEDQWGWWPICKVAQVSVDRSLLRGFIILSGPLRETICFASWDVGNYEDLHFLLPFQVFVFAGAGR